MPVLRHLPSLIAVCSLCTLLLGQPLASEAVTATTIKNYQGQEIAFTEDQFAKETKKYLGIPYRKGGASSKGMDCSGFARKIYSSLLGIDLPHSSRQQFNMPGLTKVDTKNLKTGDLLFFASKKRINHVGIYLSDRRFIHASRSQGIMISSLDDRYWKKRYFGSKRHQALPGLIQDGSEESRHGTVEISVNSEGIFFAQAAGLVSRTDLSLEGSPQGLLAQNYGPAVADDDDLRYYQLGYNHSLAEELAIGLSTGREQFDTSRGWLTHDLVLADSFAQNRLSHNETDYRQTLTLSGSFAVDPQFSISPFITWFDYLDDDVEQLPERAIGVNTHYSPSDSWSLSWTLQYSDLTQDVGLSEQTSERNSLDMMVKLGVNLSDNMQFSIFGKHGLSLSDNESADPLASQDGGSDIFMTFGFSY